MKSSDFNYLSELLKKRSGLALTEDKIYLIESRLLPIAKQLGLENIAKLCEHLRMQPTESLLVDITEAMTTNESSFFRDTKPYEQLRSSIIPALMKEQAASKQLRIWSAACSTGQEPYTIAICLKEDSAKMPGWNVEIIASDLASKVVDKAKQGIYSQFEVQRGMPIQLLIKYFSQLPDTTWQLKDMIRNVVDFRLQNLLESYDALGKFDLVFCRNVLIYFDDATKGGITQKMKQVLQPHGILIIGSTESLVDPDGDFVAVDNFRGAYRLK